jgi:hypothetical protein
MQPSGDPLRIFRARSNGADLRFRHLPEQEQSILKPEPNGPARGTRTPPPTFPALSTPVPLPPTLSPHTPTPPPAKICTFEIVTGWTITLAKMPPEE